MYVKVSYSGVISPETLVRSRLTFVMQWNQYLAFSKNAAFSLNKYTQKKKFSQYLCFLIKSTILDISLSNCIYELYHRSFTCIRLFCDK